MTRVAVITPYYRTPTNWLRQCRESVRRQTHPCTHVFVADGEAQAVVDTFGEGVQHVVLPVNHADYGDTPRAVAGMLAAGQGFDAIAYLDSDCWWRPNHVERLLALQAETGAAVLSAMRSYHHVETHELMGVCLGSDGKTFVDTNCLMLMRPAFGTVAGVWATMDPDFHPIDDRVIWWTILQSGLARAHSMGVTVCYRVKEPGVYQGFGRPVPPGLKKNPALGRAHRKWLAAGYPELTPVWRAMDARRLKNGAVPERYADKFRE
jgi:hypothetical protein